MFFISIIIVFALLSLVTLALVSSATTYDRQIDDAEQIAFLRQYNTKHAK